MHLRLTAAVPARARLPDSYHSSSERRPERIPYVLRLYRNRNGPYTVPEHPKRSDSIPGTQNVTSGAWVAPAAALGPIWLGPDRVL